MTQFPKTMYKTVGKTIESVRVVAETEKFVTVVKAAFFGDETYTRREAKSSLFGCAFFDTWEEAKAHLISDQEQEVKNLRLQLERANGRLGQLRGMKNPSPECDAKLALSDTCNKDSD